MLAFNLLWVLSGMVRTMTQWTELLHSAGLKIVNFWTIGPEDEGLIEAIVER